MRFHCDIEDFWRIADRAMGRVVCEGTFCSGVYATIEKDGPRELRAWIELHTKPQFRGMLVLDNIKTNLVRRINRWFFRIMGWPVYYTTTYTYTLFPDTFCKADLDVIFADCPSVIMEACDAVE